MWKEVKRYGVPTQIVDLIKESYRGLCVRANSCADRSKARMYLSPIMFLIVTDAVMRNVTQDRRQGIRWGLVDRLEDLDFADDLSLLSEAWRPDKRGRKGRTQN